jgi:hypothetical protein
MTVATDKYKVSAYLDADVKELATRLAKKRSRSLSSLIEVLLKEAIAKDLADPEPEWTFQDRLPSAPSDDGASL